MVARVTDALLFGMAHRGSVDNPIVQILLGYYFGALTQDAGYRLGEAVFLHTWWDVLAFLGTFHYRLVRQKPEGRLPVLWSPPLTYVF